MTLSIRQSLLALVVTLFLFSSHATEALAQPCGDIIGSRLLAGFAEPAQPISISDCNNPFGVTIDPPNPYTVQVNGEVIQSGATIAVPGSRVQNVSYTGRGEAGTSVSTELFKHVGDDYVYVSRERPEPTEDDFRVVAETYFSTQAERDFYLEIVAYVYEYGNLDRYAFDSETGEDSIDAVTGQTVLTRYYDFVDALYENFDDSESYIEAGTYTMLFQVSFLELTQKIIWDAVKEFIIPTAHAQCLQCIPDRTYTVTFTITDDTIEPAGASSVLFLPGIMGSHLYEMSDECFGFGEQRRWFSFSECDQQRLETNFLGQSINDIYTREGAVVEKAAVVNLYESFLDSVQAWKAQDIISDYVAIPYDWRLALGNVVKSKKSDSGIVTHDPTLGLTDRYLYQEIVRLASESKSGKVTLVTHSNGGLVAKRFLSDLEAVDDPLLEKIDNLIMVGVPQAGTPDAVVGVLHGTELDFVMSQETTRSLLNTMPFVHHLLPTSQYFSTVETPVITFEAGSVTDSLANQFGQVISSKDSLHTFLDNDNGRPKADSEDLKSPQVVEGALLSYADIEATIQSNWSPPASMRVHQLAGTGLNTPSQIQYFTDRRCLINNSFVCLQGGDKLSYRVIHTIDGDGTVVTPSASAMSEGVGVERWWLNLDSYNNDGFLGTENLNKEHKNIFEVDEISDFVNNIINKKEFNSYRYLLSQTPDLNSSKRLVFQLHSPLDMKVTTSEGELSSTTESIAGGVYRRYGDLQYISLPNTRGLVTVVLTGMAEGSFTFEVEEWEGNEMKEREQYQGIPSTLGTIVTFTIEEDTADLLQIDFDGDGIVDGEINQDGTVTDLRPVVTEEVEQVMRRSPTYGTRIRMNDKGSVLGMATSSTLTPDEQYRAELYRLLKELSHLLHLLALDK